MSSEVIKCPTIGAASFGQSPYIASHLPVWMVVGHNIDRRITARALPHQYIGALRYVFTAPALIYRHFVS